MKLYFLYSKNKEMEKLLDIYDEYQWFIDNDFPIVLPEFYAEIYMRNKNNKKLFAKELKAKLNKIYNKNKNKYQLRKKKIKNNWQKIEREFFNVVQSFNLKIKNRYICYISFYGPSGQFKYPNIINLRVSNVKDIAEANVTIAHELIHLLIYNKVKKLNYQQTEGMVDLFFTDTKLKNILSTYKLQNMAVHNKKLFREYFVIQGN